MFIKHVREQYALAVTGMGVLYVLSNLGGERRDVLSLFQQRMYFLHPIKQVSNFAHREVAQVTHQEPIRCRECACPGCAAVELYAFSYPVHLCFS